MVPNHVSLLDPTSRLTWSLYEYAALWRAVYGAYAIKSSLETLCKEKRISSRHQVSISLRYDLSC